MKCLLSIIVGVLLLEISSVDFVTSSTVTTFAGDDGDQLIAANVVSKSVAIKHLECLPVK